MLVYYNASSDGFQKGSDKNENVYSKRETLRDTGDRRVWDTHDEPSVLIMFT